MPIELRVPITTAVIEQNPRGCVVRSEFRGECKTGVGVIHLDACRQDHHAVLGLDKRTKLHWSGDVRTYDVQELSSFPWALRYQVTTRDAWYEGLDGARVHYTPTIQGIDVQRGVSQVVVRAAVLLIVVGAMGYRRAAWLLRELFQVSVSKSSLARWVQDVADQLPSQEEIVKLLHEDKPITQGHFDEIFPKGRGGACVLVFKDEHGRIVASEEVAQRDVEHVRPFLQKLQGWGLDIQAFYIDTCEAYRKAIQEVYPRAAIQLDYFHVIQNVWRHVWKYFVGRRKAIKKQSEEVTTPWYKAKLEALAKSLWKHRHIIFKAEGRLTDKERPKLAELVEADLQVGRIRAFLKGVWNIFENSKDEAEARQALQELKRLPVDARATQFQKAINFLEDNFDRMTTYLRVPGVQRNSLAESGMRTLRRLEQEHDGFRTDASRDAFLRIYQAIKYLGWTVHGGPIRPRAG